MEILRKTAQLRSVLSGCFLFQGAEASLVDETLNHRGCEYAAFGAGEDVYTRRNFRRSVGLVVGGTLRSQKPSAEGEPIVLARFGPGEIFGVAALFNTSETYVSHVVSLNRSRILFLSQELLRMLFSRDARISEQYISCLSDRICYLNRKIDSFTGGRVETRLARYLSELSVAREAKIFTLPCSLTVLSRTLDVGRASLYRAMDTLSERHDIRRKGKEIEILNPEGLRLFYTNDTNRKDKNQNEDKKNIGAPVGDGADLQSHRL